MMHNKMRTSIVFSYCIDVLDIQRVSDTVMGFGFKFNNILDPSSHIK